MELRVWKTLLLQWVQKCNFIENISCLEDSDIEAFFANMQYAGVELATKQPESPLNITPFLGSLKTFLQDNYPDFEPHFEHDGRIANEDYIYVYTLLMHYTCIQSPITYFHNICNDLPKTMQQCIVVFFEQIVNDPELTRNRLRRIIRNIREDAEINTNSSVSALASSTTDSTPIDNDAIGCANPVTPSPVQKKLHSLCDSSQMPVPSTPRTELLEQRTRELLGLRAELATERYEKTFLEEQIIEDEKLINSLSERNKQLAQMKAVLQKENDEENCANSIVTNEVDNLKRQLQKELSNKDDIIAERDEQMLELKAKHDKVSAKLKLSEKQLRVCIEKINVLELHSESFAPMLTIKEETIACLQRDKLELEQCLKETRDELHKGREVLNASSDLLDTSQSASSMNTTPETLACSVIDKQLREKEQENEELREQLTSIRVATACIVDGILKIAQQHQVEIPTKPNDDVQLLNLIRRSMEKLSSSFVQEEQRVKELQDQFNIQIQQCAHHEENIQHLKNNAEKLAKELEDSQSNLKTSNEKLQNNEIEITKKDKELLQLSEELIKFGNQERTLQDRIATESELSLKQCQMLSEQEKIIQTQELKLAEQQAKLTDAQNQLKRFLDRVSAQVNTKIASMSSGENGLKEVENVLMRMCNQLEESKVEMAAKCEQLTAQDHFLMQMLKTLNAHIEQPIGPNNIVTLPKNLQFLNMKLALFVSKYEHLHAKCNSLESDNLQTVENMRQLVSELEENTIIRKQLEKQCDELMQQMQQKSEECEKITQQLQSEKANKTTIQSELGKELQTLKLTCQDLKMTKEQQLLDRESLQKGLQKQCDELMQQLQQKSEECEKITQQLQSEKANKTTIQSELGKELQTLKLTCQDLKMTKEQQLLDRESLQKGLQKQCDELMQQLQQKSEECEKITQQLQSEKANKTTIQSELGKELQTLKLTCQDLKMTKEQQLLDRESLQKGLQKQCDELMQQLQQKSEECEKITQQLQSEKANKTTIQSELGKELQTLKLTCQDLKMTKEQQLLDRESLRRGLQKKCDELMQQLQQKSEECEKITQQLQSEKANKTTIQSELGKELQTLKMTCQDLEMTKEQQLLDRESLRRRLQKKCDELMQQLQQKSEECEKITQQLQSSKASKTTIEGELGMALQKLELAEKTKEQQLHDRESLIEDLQKKCDELMQQLQQKSEECEKVTQQLQSEKASKTTIEGELGMALQKLELAEKTKEQRLHDRESLIEDLQKKCDELMQQLQQKSDECEKITQALQVEKASKTTIQSELGMELQKLESACQALEMIKEQQSHERESLVLDIQKLHDELKVKKLKILTVEEEQNRQLVQKNTVEKELETVKATLAQRELQLEQSKTQLDTYTKRLERTVIKLGEQQAVVSKTQRELVQIKFAQEEQAKLLNAMQHEKEGLQLELRTSKERANRSEEKLSSLEQQYMKIQSLEQQQERKIKLEKVRDIADKKMILVTEEENTRLRLQIGALNSDIVQQQKRIGDLTDELQLANDTIAKVRQELEANKALQCDLDDKLKHLKSECEKANERESHYQRKLKALKDELEESLADNIDIRNSKETMLDTLHKENRMVLDQMNKQKAKEHQMELDCQILQAKYRDAKEEIGRCEQKLKDQRLEMEGKLEKMKSKMRALYKAEVIRMKEKQERDATSNKAELEKLTAQNNKYDEHTRALSAQIVRLNEIILEQQKQHAILSTKLRHLHETESAASASSPSDDWHPFKRPSAPSANLGSNLAMEDEEGEVFNNTYLTDLKLGRVPDITTEELQYRNSLQPPHLKSTYAAQYDLGSQESDLKDGPHGLDDSMSALLSTTGGNCTGTRKKSMGTHYKRPGPPTPSKNGGRLSFGSSEPAREILRETYDNNGSTKTPARFKIFASRFSMGSSGATGGGGQCLPRDEQRHSHRKKKVLPLNQRRNPRLREEGVFCTSTPRTSRSYFDNLRRNLLSDAAIVAQQEVQEGTTPHLSNAMPLIMNNPQVRRLTLCRRPPVSSASSTASGVSSHNRRKRKSTARKSVCPHGNIFVMDRRRGVLPATGSQQRLQQRTKGKQNRIQCFDQARHMGDNSSEIESESEQKTNDNNNYSSHNRNKATYSNLTELEESQQPQMALDVTQEGNNYIQQLHQQFEADHVCAWLNGAANVSAANATEHSHDFHFDQLCLQTESTAPFELQPLQYDELPSNTEQQNDVGAIVLPTNITAISTSNVSYTTNVSSCQSWTTLSSVAVRSHALPEVTLMPCKHSSTAPEWRVVYQPHANILSQLGHCIAK
ncbi:sporulation-specific protein 15 isoform X2 [Drosophila grimshawi]|uniref:sporulation-specific protein 15 isoform X2 n=1 Tax=Drosophila grimshawi TaxID=7222 RepID=UPI001C933F34|nr:sporulation-specific protein 15 isoform X2 [Drosophila grimshawi]